MTNPVSKSRRVVRTLVAVAAAALMATTGTAYASYVAGVDTSHYQHSPSLNWTKVAASGVKFAFLKATESTTYIDPYFKADWAASASAGIYRGAYHFARPSAVTGSAVRQADFFASVIGYQRSAGTLPPVLDLETTGGLSPTRLIRWTRQFLQEVQLKTGRDPMIYVSPSFWIYNLHNSTAFHGYPLWIAHWGVSQPTVPGGWPAWSFWQSSSTGRIQGISGNVDKDVFNGSMAQLQQFALVGSGSRIATKLSLTVTNRAPTAGDPIRFNGLLTDVAGAPLAGRTVRLQTRPPGSTTWTRVATMTTGSNGGFRKWMTTGRSGTYRVFFRRTPGYRRSWSPGIVVTVGSAASALTLHTPATAPKNAAGSESAPGPSLTGTLTSGGEALAGRRVTIQRRAAGSTIWTRVGTVTTDASGAYHIDTAASQSSTYRATYAGETGHLPAASTFGSVRVTRSPAALSFALSNAAPYQGRSVRMYGRLLSGTAAIADRTVAVQRQLPDTTTWRTVATPTTDAAGRYSYTRVLQRSASYRAVFPGDAAYVSAAANPATVQISPPRRTLLDLTADGTQLGAGRSTLLRGALTVGGKGLVGTVRLWQRPAGQQSWNLVNHTATALPDGTFRISVAPQTSTVYKLVFDGTSDLRRSQSRVRITVS